MTTTSTEWATRSEQLRDYLAQLDVLHGPRAGTFVLWGDEPVTHSCGPRCATDVGHWVPACAECNVEAEDGNFVPEVWPCPTSALVTAAAALAEPEPAADPLATLEDDDPPAPPARSVGTVVTAVDLATGYSETITIRDDFVVITDGRARLTSRQVHANGTAQLTVKVG